jgi:imidazolonepropionase-like amidohydrolase
MEKKRTTVFASTLYDGKTRLENRSLTLEGNRIVRIEDGKKECDYLGIVTPAFIDPHTHLGMVRQGEPEAESDVNDHIDQITPLNDPLNAIYFDDRGLEEAVDFGVLYSCIVPGSGNLLGGKATVIRTFASNREEGFYKDYGYKMALGYNPKSVAKAQWQGTRPTTRMGIYSHLEEKLDAVILKEKKAALEREKKLHELNSKAKEGEATAADKAKSAELINDEYKLAFSGEEQALLELLRGEKTAKVHVHKEDDVLYLIELVRKYGLKVTADHACDVFHVEIFDKLAAHNIRVVYGPIGSLDYKVELKHASYRNVRALMTSKAFYGLMTDHPVILTTNLRDSLKYFLIQGMSEADAIALITDKNARILGIDDELGTLEEGKLASLLVWDRDPLHLGAFPRTVIAEGRVVRGQAGLAAAG